VTIFTKSKFYYGHTVSFDNRNIDFQEGSIVRTATLRPRGYTLTGFAAEIARAMNIVGTQDYFTTIDRDTRQITISSNDEFSLLPASGPSAGQSALPLAGFSSDLLGENNYQGEASGRVFFPQLRLQDYTPFEDDEDSVDSVINESASGRVETVTFGRARFMTCNIRYQNEKKTNFTDFNANAISELREFMQYITTKASIEFMPDKDDSEEFFSCILERTARSSSGTGFRLVESDGIAGFYDSGRLTFREQE